MKLFEHEEEHLNLREFGSVKDFDLDFKIHLISSHRIEFAFELKGELSHLLVEDFDGCFQRKDGLWESTCFELFVGSKDRTSYVEWNFSPSSSYQTYYFDDYRKRREAESSKDLQHLHALQCKKHSSMLLMEGCIETTEAIDRKNFIYWPTAVLQKKDLERFYFAHKHPKRAPDFHLNFLTSFANEEGASLV